MLRLSIVEIWVSMGAVYQIVFVTTKEYLNRRTCFASNGSSDYKVMPQGIFPDMGQYTVR